MYLVAQIDIGAADFSCFGIDKHIHHINALKPHMPGIGGEIFADQMQRREIGILYQLRKAVYQRISFRLAKRFKESLAFVRMVFRVIHGFLRNLYSFLPETAV